MNNHTNAQTISAAAANTPKNDVDVGQQAQKIGEGQPKVEPKPQAAPASKI